MRINPIQTSYKGYKFRSRNEARWAVFFHSLGIRFLYEEEGFDLNGTWYLPDFYLPLWDKFVEIKPNITPTQEEIEKIAKLALYSQKSMMVIMGSPYPGEYNIIFLCPTSDNSSMISISHDTQSGAHVPQNIVWGWSNEEQIPYLVSVNKPETFNDGKLAFEVLGKHKTLHQDIHTLIPIEWDILGNPQHSSYEFRIHEEMNQDRLTWLLNRPPFQSSVYTITGDIDAADVYSSKLDEAFVRAREESFESKRRN